ncbi:MAG: hypothetical protein JWM06_1469 [Actinomycetia bacterium]|jgi:hypothetical protein|nr:hypothetical protein [Actinomycetes bacterium]
MIDLLSTPVGVQARRLRDELDSENLRSTFKGDCVSFLRLFRDHPDDCSAAVIHPLGFAVFRWEFSERAALRVHVWSDLTRQEDSSVDARHDHPWRLRSFVLVGALTDHILGVEPFVLGAEAGDAEVLEVARVIQRNETDVVAPTRELVRITERESHRMQSGDFYTVPPGAIHWTEAGPGRPIATVVSAAVEADVVPRTLIPPGTPGRPQTERRRIVCSLRQQIVDDVLAAFEGGSVDRAD